MVEKRSKRSRSLAIYLLLLACLLSTGFNIFSVHSCLDQHHTASNVNVPGANIRQIEAANENNQAIPIDAIPCQSLCECFRDSAVRAHRAAHPLQSKLGTLKSSQKENFFPSLNSIWRTHAWPILDSFYELDLGDRSVLNDHQKYKQWLEQMFQILTPFRLERSRKAPPDPKALPLLHQILEKRYFNASEPPLRIAAFGGSVTAGHEYEQNKIGLNIPNPKPTQGKAWSMRLEKFINTALGFHAVEVLNMAVSATTSDIGSMILEYGLFPPDYPKSGPDIVIWSFATNDVASKVLTKKSGSDELQKFMTMAQELRCGPLPLVMAVDDLGVYPGLSSQFTAMTSTIEQIALWNRALAISYGDTIRDFVIANPSESSLNNEWERGGHSAKDAVEGFKRHQRIHPGLGVHIALSWIVAYNFLKEATGFCQNELDGNYWEENENNVGLQLGDPLPDVPFPAYHSKLDSRSVLSLWKQKEQQEAKICANKGIGEARTLCSYAWISNRLSQMGTKAQIKNLMKQILVTFDGWAQNGVGGSGDASDKVGWEATKHGASFTIEHQNRLEKESIRVITIVCLHSYGEKWDGSRVKMSIMEGKNDKEVVREEHMVGFHSSATSIFHPYKFELAGDTAIPPGGVLRIKFDLVGGSTFKILGITFCSS